jgi:DNA-binding NarL/FixJ family response regulator
VVGEAADGERAVELIDTLRPDVVLLDVRMPKLSGLDVLERLAQNHRPLHAILLLTTFDDDPVLLRALRLGACGVLRKDISLDDLAGAIQAAAAGQTVVRPAVTERVLSQLRLHKPGFESSPLPEPLTQRELEVLRLMASGLSNREIGELIGTSEGTVKTHASSILSKLGVRDRTRAVLKALELGYV